MVGSDGYLDKAHELFLKLDQNSDGYISPKEFVAIVRKDESILKILQGKI